MIQMMIIYLRKCKKTFVTEVSLIRTLIVEKKRYRIRDRIKQRKSERKGALKDTRNIGKVLQKSFKTVVNVFRKIYHLWENLVQKFPI